MATRFMKEIVFDGDHERVYGLLTDREFRIEVAKRAGATSVEATGEQTAAGMVETVETRQPAEGLPSAAQKLLGGELHVRQVETWRSDREADMDVSVPGKPGHIKGTIRLEERGESTVQIVEAEAVAHIPIIGGKVEQVICRVLGHLLKLQGTVAHERLGT